MQLLWKMFKKNQFEANIDECGIEIGTPHGGYQYEVTKPAVLHIVMSGTGTLYIQSKEVYIETG
ncbi:hypothetical protein AAHB43_00600 [Staphylococcus pseudintermedius]